MIVVNSVVTEVSGKKKFLGYNKKKGRKKRKSVYLVIDSNLVTMPLMNASLISVCCSLYKWCLQQAHGAYGVHWRN